MGSVNLTGPNGWSLAFANFVNPSYISGPAGAADPNPSVGFDISSTEVVVIGFTGTYAGVTLIHEQTLDPAGLVGWFPVQGVEVDNTGIQGTTLAATGVAYVFPALGFRHRMRVTAMASGTIVARIGLTVQGALAITNSSVQPAGGNANLTSRIPTSANTLNATIAKAAPAKLFQAIALNTTATITYLKIYNQTTAPAPAADAANLLFTLPIPANGALAVDWAFGFTASAGLAYVLTTDAADVGVTAPAAGAIVGLNLAFA